MRQFSTILILAVGVLFSQSLLAQVSFKLDNVLYSQNYFSDLNEASQHPDSVLYLNLSLNKFSQVPDEIYLFKDLKYLDLSFNRITDVNIDITKFKKLEVLNLSGNNFVYLPKQFSKMKSLKELHLKENTMSEEAVQEVKEFLPDCLVITH